MTRADIIRMACEVGFEVHARKQQARVGIDALLGIDSTNKLERFASLVAAAEREACAQLCEDYQDAVDRHKWPDGYTLASAIREKE